MVQLKSLLRERSLNTSGLKAGLCARLVNSLMEEGLDPDTFVANRFECSGGAQPESTQGDVEPGESASQVRSNYSHRTANSSRSGCSIASSAKSERLKETAKKAALEARKKFLLEKQIIQREKQRIQDELEVTNLNMEIAECGARAKVFEEFEEEERCHMTYVPVLQDPRGTTLGNSGTMWRLLLGVYQVLFQGGRGLGRVRVLSIILRRKQDHLYRACLGLFLFLQDRCLLPQVILI